MAQNQYPSFIGPTPMPKQKQSFIGPAPMRLPKPSFIGPQPPPRIGPDPYAAGPANDETEIDRATLDVTQRALKGLGGYIPSMEWGGGEGGSASGSPYDMSRARNAAGVTRQVGGDVNLPTGQRNQFGGVQSGGSFQGQGAPTDRDIELPGTINNRADAINARANHDFFDDALRYPETRSAQTPPQAGPLQGLQGARPKFAQQSPEAVGQFAMNSTANDPIKLQQLRQAQLDEQNDRMFNLQASQGGRLGSPTAGPFQDYANDIEGMPGGIRPGKLDNSSEIAAMKGLIGRTQGSMAADPYTGAAAQKQQGDMDAANLDAQMGGFRTPQEQAEAARQAEAYKVNAPVRAQEAAGEADFRRQQEQSRGALAVEEARQGGMEGRYEALQQLMMGGGGRDIRSINPTSGAMSFGAEQQVPTGMAQDITNARQRLVAAEAQRGAVGKFVGAGGGQVDIAQQQLDAAVNSYLARHPAPTFLKEAAKTWANDPQYSGMSLPEILAAEGEDQVDANEMDALQDLLANIRGH